MKTITLNLYTLNELSEDAQRNAISNIQEYFNFSIFDYLCDDVKKSVDALCDRMGIKAGRTYADIIINNNEFLELDGIRLYKYILNNYYSMLFKPYFIKSLPGERISDAFINKLHTNHKGEKSTFIYSRNKVSNNCVLTGCCTDDYILKPFYDFLKNPHRNTSGHDLIKETEAAIEKAFRGIADMEHDAGLIKEFILDNDYHFSKEGNLMNL